MRRRMCSIEGALRQARQKLTDAEQKNQRASAALIEALATAKAMIDEANKRAEATAMRLLCSPCC